jgi:hypothetical protein
MLGSCFRLVVAVALTVLAFEGSAFAGEGVRVPEIDAGTMTTALALLSGAALVITNRFRRSK